MIRQELRRFLHAASLSCMPGPDVLRFLIRVWEFAASLCLLHGTSLVRASLLLSSPCRSVFFTRNLSNRLMNALAYVS
jgi:hypothetical protein